MYTWLTELPFYLNKWGVTWTPVDGWETRATSTIRYVPTGLINHHTAGPAWYPVDRLLTKCNLYIDPGGLVHLISAGYQADSGMGDKKVLARVLAKEPVRPPSDIQTSDRINGNPYFVDIEVGHPGDGSPIPPIQRQSLIRCNAAIVDYLKLDVPSQLLGHKEWTRRKIDPRWSLNDEPDLMGDIREDTANLLKQDIMPRELFEQMIEALFAGNGEFQGDPNYWINKIDTPYDPEWADFWAAFTRMVS